MESQKPSLDTVYSLVSSHLTDLEKDIKSLLPSFQENIEKAENLNKKLGELQEILHKEIKVSKKKLDNLLSVVNIKDNLEYPNKKQKIDNETIALEGLSNLGDTTNPKKLSGTKKKIFDAVERISNGSWNVTTNDVAAAIGMNPGNISSIMKELTDKGYFVRKCGTSPADPYRYKIKK